MMKTSEGRKLIARQEVRINQKLAHKVEEGDKGRKGSKEVEKKVEVKPVEEVEEKHAEDEVESAEVERQGDEMELYAEVLKMVVAKVRKLEVETALVKRHSQEG